MPIHTYGGPLFLMTDSRKETGRDVQKETEERNYE